MKKTGGTEELEGKRTEKKSDEKGKEKGGKKSAEHKGLHVSKIEVEPQHDGTHHITHHLEDKDGMPHHRTFGYTAATKQDVADHMMEHLPEGPADQEGAGAPGTGGGDGGEEDAAMPPQPGGSQPGM